MVKISVIGICGVSLFMGVNHFHENGETLIADSVFEEVGGKGINQSVAAERMGAEVSFLTAVGDDGNAEKCRLAAADNNINAFFRVKPGKSTPFAVILTDKNGENRVTEYGTVELDENDVAVFEDEIAKSDVLLLQQEIPQNINDTAIKIAARHGVKVILNPAPIRKISDDTARYVYAVTPNAHEAQAIDIKHFANCIVTLGGEGCMINGRIKLPALNVRPVDTTGAGDTFNGALAVCIGKGMDIENACRYAVAASGLRVSKKYVMSAIPYMNEVEDILKRGEYI